jgi:Uma2 family endonuclease
MIDSTAMPVLTVAELLERFGPMPANRIRSDPPPGQATEKDLLRIMRREDRLYELVDGVLVEKTVGIRESYLAGLLIHLLVDFVKGHDLGIVTAPDGTVRLMPGLVRVPDVAFISWKQLPGRVLPDEPMPDLAPDLAIEVLSAGNTKQEMERKLKDYFLAGVRLVWYVDPRSRTAEVHTAPDERVVLTEKQSLSGGEVLPGLKVPLSELFALVPDQEKDPAKKKGPSRRARRRRDKDSE